MMKRVGRQIAQIKNAFGLGLGIMKSKALGRRTPLMTSFHVTGRCNLRCPYCYANYDGRFENPPPDLSGEEILDAVDELHELGMRWLTVLGGEPMLRDDIGRIIRHAKAKGILVELVTNGHLVPRKLEDVIPADFVCVSIEGDRERHDRARDMAGSYDTAVRALEALRGKGPLLRIHATLLRSTLDGGMEHLARLAEKYDAQFGYSQVIVHDYNDTEEVRFEDDELRDFWKRLARFKASGAPCYNSGFVLDYISRWPVGYREIIGDERRFGKHPDFEFIPCQYGRRYCYIDSEGFMYRCIVRGIKNGPNIKEVGVKAAWEALGERPCAACSYIQHIEVNALLNMSPGSVIKGARYILRP